MGTAVTTATEQRSLRFGVIGLVGVLLLAAFALAPPAMPARAAANVVTDCGNDPAVSGTLPYAVVNAVANDTITFAQDCNGATAPNNTITLTAPLIPTVNVTIDATAPAHIVTISGNNAAQLFAVNNVTLALRGLTLTGGNNSTGGAVGIASGGMANTSGCTFTGNTATSGGAIFNGGVLRVVNSTFTNNTAGSSGGAIYNGGTLTVVGSTVTGNTANAGGVGGIYTGTSFTLTLSAVAGNNGGGAAPDISGTVNSGGGNVIGNARGATGFIASDKPNTDPQLFPLNNNGGTVRTTALQSTSPAIDILACSTDPITGATLSTDARRYPRPQGALCDAGAYEANGASPQAFVVTTGTADTGPTDAACNTAANGGCTLRQAANLSNLTAGIPLALTAAVTMQPAHGSLTLNPGGGFTYTPTTDYAGADSFTYTARNGDGTFGTGSSIATVTLAVNGVAPNAGSFGATVTTGVSVSIPMLAHVFSGTPAAILTAVGTPMHGTATISGTNVTYIATGGYVGTDTFTYTISNGNGSFGTGSSTGTVTVTVNAATVTSLSVTAPPANGGTMPNLRVGATLALATTAAYSNSTTGTPVNVTYSGYDPNVLAVDANAVVKGIASGTTTIMVSAPDGKGGTATTTITITITGGSGGGLMNPNPQPGVKPNTTALPGATVAPQPTRKADGAGAGVLPQAAGPTPEPTATPGAQPSSH